MLNFFLGKKEICREMLEHSAVRYWIGNLTAKLAKKWGWLFIRFFGYPLMPRRRVRDRSLFENLPKNGTILDVGCSFGVYSFPLAIKGYSVVGLDLNEESLVLAKKIKNILNLTNVLFLKEDIFDCDFSSALFDAILVIEVLEHIRKDSCAISHLRKFLKPGGILLVSVPFAEIMEEYEEAIPATRGEKGTLVCIGKGGAHYRNGYNLIRLTKLLEENGFSAMKSFYTSLPAGFPNSMLLFPLTYPIAILLNRLSKNRIYITAVAAKS